MDTTASGTDGFPFVGPELPMPLQKLRERGDEDQYLRIAPKWFEVALKVWSKQEAKRLARNEATRNRRAAKRYWESPEGHAEALRLLDDDPRFLFSCPMCGATKRVHSCPGQ